jgi:hypothetical protein
LIEFIEPAPIEPSVKKEGLESVAPLWEDHQPMSVTPRRSKQKNWQNCQQEKLIID